MNLGIMLPLFLIFLPVILIMGALLANEAKPKKNIVLGVTLPYGALGDPRVARLCAGYKKRLWLCCGLCAAVLLPALFLPRLSLQMAVLFVWVLPAVFAPMAVFARANLRLAALKRAEGWTVPYAGTTAVDLGGEPGKLGRPLSRWLFVPPVAISLVPFFLSLGLEEEGMRLGGAILSGSFALCSGLGIFLYPLIFRQRRDVVGEDSELNAALTRVRRYNWGKTWIALAWLSGLFAVAVWFLRDSELWLLVSAGAYTFALLGLCMQAEFSARRAQERLTASVAACVDEDVWWLWGLLYCNPNDRRLMINDRVGVGMGMNVARPAGKVIMGFALLCVLAMPLAGGWFVAVDYAPRRAEVADGLLTYAHLTERYEIPLDEIASVELLWELPTGRRVAGTGMDTLLEGRFAVEGYANARISLDPRQPPFIAVVTEGGETRLWNLMSPEETEALYETIRSVSDHA